MVLHTRRQKDPLHLAMLQSKMPDRNTETQKQNVTFFVLLKTGWRRTNRKQKTFYFISESRDAEVFYSHRVDEQTSRTTVSSSSVKQ